MFCERGVILIGKEFRRSRYAREKSHSKRLWEGIASAHGGDANHVSARGERSILGKPSEGMSW